jgi:hypothetical protein
MRNTLALVFALAVPTLAHAQSKDDQRASLVGLNHIAVKEAGVASLGGGTQGSPYILQVTERFKKNGISPAELDSAAEKGIPVYELVCSSMEWSDASIRVACEARLMRQVTIPAGESTKGIYAITWTSKMVIASFPDHPTAVTGLDELTATLADQFITDYVAANPGAKPLPGKKK